MLLYMGLKFDLSLYEERTERECLRITSRGEYLNIRRKGKKRMGKIHNEALCLI
jgi:hypothetical protein